MGTPPTFWQVVGKHEATCWHTMGVYTQPVAELQLSVVHATPSLHAMGVGWQPLTALHRYVLHLSEAAVASQLDLIELGVYVQPVPATHLSSVHTLLSLHTAVNVLTHAPLLVAHEYVAHDATLCATQAAAAALCVYTHPEAVLHVSSVQAFLSSHVVGTTSQLPVPALHVRVLHLSLVHELATAVGVYTHPVVGLHESSVQALPSLQVKVGVHTAVPEGLLHVYEPHLSDGQTVAEMSCR